MKTLIYIYTGICALLANFAFAMPSPHDFWIWDLTKMPPTYRRPAFEAVTLSPELPYAIWIEKNQSLSVTPPSPTTLEKLANTTRITLQTLPAIFGEIPTPPSQDRQLHILLAEIQPFIKKGIPFGFDGHFQVYDQLNEAEANALAQHSNERNIIYLNTLQDLSSDYMQAILAHETVHLLTHNGNDRTSWLEEMLGEGGMILLKYFTDANHVHRYLSQHQPPLAVETYGMSYGAVALFAEYLLHLSSAQAFGSIARVENTETDFQKIEAVYQKPWSELFNGYVRWLVEQNSKSGFELPAIQSEPTPNGSTFTIAPTSVRFFSENISFEWSKLILKETPEECKNSKNDLKVTTIQNLIAVWVESSPPCALKTWNGKQNFEYEF